MIEEIEKICTSFNIELTLVTDIAGLLLGSSKVPHEELMQSLPVL